MAVNVEELRRSVKRNSGRGMKISVRVADLRGLLDLVDSAESRVLAAEAKAPSKGKTKELADRVAVLAASIRFLGALVEDGEECGLSAPDALRAWSERLEIEADDEIEAVTASLASAY